MFIPVTAAALVLLTVAMLLLRIFWSRIPSWLRFLLIRLSIAVILVQGFFVLTKWNTTSDRFNAILNWLAVAGYALLVLLFSRLSPRWLTIPTTIILLVPIFSASVIMPLTLVFQPETNAQASLNDHLFYGVQQWANAGGGSVGVDVNIYYRSPLAPFLRHKLRFIPFNNQECNSFKAIAVAFPDKKIILGRCPRWPTQPAGTVDRAVLLP
jgi:hypothetical protein